MDLTLIFEAVKHDLEAHRASPRQTIESREERDQRKIEALDWIRRWGYSFLTIIKQIDSGKSKNLILDLVIKGYVEKTKSDSRLIKQQRPLYFLTLTKKGLNLIETINNYESAYKIQPNAYDQDNFRHNFIAQNLTISAINAGKIIAFLGIKDALKKSESVVKEPDAIWIDKYGNRIGLEVEISEKYKERFNHFVYSSILALQNEDSNLRLDYIVIFSQKEITLKKYQKAFKPGNLFFETFYDAKTKKYKVGSSHLIPQSIAGRVACVSYK